MFNIQDGSYLFQPLPTSMDLLVVQVPRREERGLLQVALTGVLRRLAVGIEGVDRKALKL